MYHFIVNRPTHCIQYKNVITFIIIIIIIFNVKIYYKYIFFFLSSRLYRNYSGSVTTVLNLYLTRSSTSSTHIPVVLIISYSTASNHFFFCFPLPLFPSIFISIAVLSVSESSHNMIKPPKSILSHILHNRHYSYASSHIFISYLPIFSCYPSHLSNHSHLCSIFLSTPQHSKPHTIVGHITLL